MMEAPDSPPDGEDVSQLAVALADAHNQRDIGQGAATQEVQLLLMRVQNQPYALPSACVRAVTMMESIAELPLSPPHVQGIFSYYGHITAVVDLSILSGREPTRDAHRLVIIEANGLEAALPITASLGFITVSRDRIEPRPPNQGANDHVVGQLLQDPDIYFVLDPARLLDKARVQGEGAEAIS